MTKLEYGLAEIGLTDDDIYWDDDYTANFISDDRQAMWKKEKEKYGFDDREMWSLGSRIAIFIYPRLKYFREYCDDMSIPMTLTLIQWQKILDMMLFSVRELSTDFAQSPVKNGNESEEEYFLRLKKYKRKYHDGMIALGIWLPALWY